MDGWEIALEILNLVLLVFGGLLLKSYLPSYFEQKGKNLATKEDIEEITIRTEKALQLQRRREAKIGVLEEYLAQFARLIELYRFMACGEGQLKTDENGKFVWEERLCEPDQDMNRAFEDIEGISLRSAIYQVPYVLV